MRFVSLGCPCVLRKGTFDMQYELRKRVRYCLLRLHRFRNQEKRVARQKLGTIPPFARKNNPHQTGVVPTYGDETR